MTPIATYGNALNFGVMCLLFGLFLVETRWYVAVPVVALAVLAFGVAPLWEKFHSRDVALTVARLTVHEDDDDAPYQVEDTRGRQFVTSAKLYNHLEQGLEVVCRTSEPPLAMRLPRLLSCDGRRR